MIINKITSGYVVQEYDTEIEQFAFQTFYAGDETNIEYEDGSNVIDPSFCSIEKEYLPFDMVQPKIKYDILDIKNSHLYHRLNNVLCEIHDCNLESQAARDMLIKKVLETI